MVADADAGEAHFDAFYVFIIHLHSSTPTTEGDGTHPSPSPSVPKIKYTPAQPFPPGGNKIYNEKKNIYILSPVFLRFSFYFHSEIWFRTSSDMQSLNFYKLSVLLLLPWIFICIFIYFLSRAPNFIW